MYENIRCMKTSTTNSDSSESNLHPKPDPNSKPPEPKLANTRKTRTRETRTLNGSVIGSLFQGQKPEQPDPKNLKHETRNKTRTFTVFFPYKSV
ncbi:hypothetical protein HanIR_Chr10g0456051 [Helianthus annuus]|nr:hypothetical protein HanIR_Chr10g0456051 [Helianthus annuus]